MITRKEYKKHPEKYWLGKKVKPIRELRNGYVVIPKGFIMRITRKYNGFEIKGVNTCPHCHIGARLSISCVEPEILELVNEGE